MGNEFNEAIKLAALTITQADAILIGAGAGMGVDSGLPDFRGDEGFWRAYPPMKKLGLSFYDLANPMWFEKDPQRAWGFYGHRRNLYRETEPHDGFKTLLKWTQAKLAGGFVFTSNVDGHFQRVGFSESQVVECHGSINFSQCTSTCDRKIWQAENTEVDVDLNTFRAHGELPKCPNCDQVSRPNILMFGDYRWHEQRTEKQYKNYREWLKSLPAGKVAVIEFGAGTAVPTVRYQCEQIAKQFQSKLIRINPREAFGDRVISLEMGALEAINLINQHL